jgi:hypothetical protein
MSSKFISPMLTSRLTDLRVLAMLPACAWRDARAGPTAVVAAHRTFLGGWLGIGRIVVGMAPRATTSSSRRAP